MIIYKATNKKDGKIYIGKTNISLNERIGDHRRKAFNHKSGAAFHSAIREHGMEQFEFIIIEKAEKKSDLNERERFWISKYESTDPSKGYNETYGGNDTFKFTESARVKIGLAGKGVKRSEAFKDNLRDNYSGKNSPFYGKHHTEEAKRKNREAHLGKKLTPEHIAKCTRRGSDIGTAVINEEIARQIKILIKDGQKQREISKCLRVSIYIVKSIAQNRTWRHVTI